ncbi:MAG: hypothetical protein GY853_13000 [PVC group bacterium]|nr:hypothetical protein [PVC group bacterium]
MKTQESKIFIILTIFCLWAMCWGLQNCTAQENIPPLSYYEIIEKRNFFRPTKDLNAEVQSSGIQSAFPGNDGSAKARDLILTGVVNLKNGYKAIVEKKNQDKGFYVGINDSIENYIVKDIQKNKIILERNNQLFDLKLKQAGLSSTPLPANNNEPKTISISPAYTGENKDDYPLNTMQKLRRGVRRTK